MKQQVILPIDSNYKYYTFSEIKEGPIEVFRYVKDLKNNNFKTVKAWIYFYENKFIANTFTVHGDISSAVFRFNAIKQAKGDISKVGFECRYELEII